MDKWVVFSDEGRKATLLTFQADQTISHKGDTSLRIKYNIAPDSWATCSLVYPSPRKWNHAKGLTVYIHGERVGQEVAVVAYQGKSDGLAHFEFHATTGKEAITGWQRVDITWDKFIQPPWEGDGTASFDPAQSKGMAFVFGTSEKESKNGRLWIDEVSFLSPDP